MLVINEVSNATECEFNTSKIWCRFDVERLLEIYHCCSPVTCDSWFMCASGCHVEFFTNTSANVIKYCILSRIHRFDPAIVLLHTTSRCNTCVERMIEVFCQKYEHLKTTVPKTDPASTLTDRCVSQYDWRCNGECVLWIFIGINWWRPWYSVLNRCTKWNGSHATMVQNSILIWCYLNPLYLDLCIITKRKLCLKKVLFFQVLWWWN